MDAKMFNGLWLDALEQPDKELYIGEFGYPDWFDEISADASEIIRILEDIHAAAHMSVRDILTSAHLTQAAFATRFCIPLRTVEDWATGKRKCADYMRLAFCRELNLLKINID